MAWRDDFTEKERKEAYDEVYDLAIYLLETYKGTGKTFMFGHWEGDWYHHLGYKRDIDPKPEHIKNMIAWLNIRQKAVDDAKKKVKAKNVFLYHYTEVNLALKALKGKKCRVNSVLPYTTLDYVSYSCYDSTIRHKDKLDEILPKVLNHIESKMKPKPGIKGKGSLSASTAIPF
ncbi:MAG: hypothetical protein COA79_07415 [Planctomycetota bacterium]|nr:MAG: hypothetical protein COA79_07415 [Planctomycetota bacterium]